MFRNKWEVYTDKMGDSSMSVQVNTYYKKKAYLHTYSVTYTYGTQKELPSQNQLTQIYEFEDQLLNIVDETL